MGHPDKCLKEVVTPFSKEHAHNKKDPTKTWSEAEN